MKIPTLVLCSSRTGGAVLVHVNALPAVYSTSRCASFCMWNVPGLNSDWESATLIDVFVDFLSISRHRLKIVIYLKLLRLLHYK